MSKSDKFRQKKAWTIYFGLRFGGIAKHLKHHNTSKSPRHIADVSD